MTFKRIGLILTPAALSLVLMGCPEGGENAGTCTSDSQCLTGEICHPVEKICVKTCTAATDCPDSAKTCDVLAGAGGADGGTGTKICKCSTTQLCNAGEVGGSLVCSDETKVCVVKCSSDAACGAGRKCVNEQCKADAAVCTPACTGNQVCDPSSKTCVDKCTWDGSCAAGKVCNITSGVCETAATCSASAAQPSTCAYGQYCTASNACAWVPKATCTNFSGATPADWNPATSTGPIIYSVTGTIAPNTTWCAGGGDHVAAVVKAYMNPNTADTFPATKSEVQGFFYVKVDGSTNDVTNMMQNADYVRASDGKSVTMTLHTGCYTSNTISFGVMSTTGNEFCAQISK